MLVGSFVLMMMWIWFSSIRPYVRGPASTCQFMLVVKYLRPDQIEISVAYDNFFADHIRRSLSLFFFFFFRTKNLKN